MTSVKRKDYFIFLCGLVGTFSLRVLGTFYIIEIIAFLSYIFIPWRRSFKNPRMRKVIMMAFLWLLGAMIADWVNHTPSVELLKGWFNIIFFIGLLPFTYWALEDKPSRWIWYVAGNGLSSLLSFYFVRGAQFEGGAYEIWQLYAWGPFVVAIAALLFYKGWHKIAMITYLGWAVYALYGGSRNTFLNISLAVCIMYMIEKLKSNSLDAQVHRFRSSIVRIFLALFIGALVVDNVYENLASSGALGENAYYKYMTQKSADGGILKGGRGETFMGIELIKENPILGYGSFATYNGANDFSADLRQLLNNYYDDVDVDVDYLPAHSHVVGYWVYHGILGGMFWIYILLLMWQMFRTGAFMYEPKLIGHCVYYSAAILWAILFSPFGQRAPMAFYIAFLIVTEGYYFAARRKVSI